MSVIGHSGVSDKDAADGCDDVFAVLGGGGYVATDGVPVAGDFLERRRPEISCRVSAAPVAFGLADRGRDAQVVQEAEDVVLSAVQAFQQQPGAELPGRSCRDRGGICCGTGVPSATIPSWPPPRVSTMRSERMAQCLSRTAAAP